MTPGVLTGAWAALLLIAAAAVISVHEQNFRRNRLKLPRCRRRTWWRKRK